ncbi:F-box domain - like 10 [Theobroma cacao]|nr:F-box domain - like 10 [Theobroma cacao]
MSLTSEKRNKKNEDRMGKLPDDVLLKIMSFLNTKQAVQTCVLSKRWKSLWQSLPNLDFNFDTFPFQQEIDDEDEEELEMKMCSFSNFISQVLFRRCPTDLVKVCVQSLSYDRHASVLAGLICYAVKHNVQHVTFQLIGGCSFLMPKSLYTCHSLTSLCLKGNVCLKDFSDMLLTSEKRNKKNEDRMGKLPDAVLLKIMSFLNTKQAVQTCVLSKRWKSLWQSLPNLDFNFDTFPFQQEIDDEDEERVEMKMASFSNFISQVLFRRCPTDLVKKTLSLLFLLVEDFSDMSLTSEKRDEKNEDRMGKLPDDLLLKIMSFLNTKQAVQTCVLSQRWKPLWQSLPNLDFNFDTFPFQQEIDDEDEEELEMKMCSFSKFISQVLFRRCPTDLVKVCVQSHVYDPHCFLVDGLICYAVKHNVQQLTVHLLSDCPYLFPESFWTCRSLTSLELKVLYGWTKL